MTDGPTIIIHDWENNAAAKELARSLADNPDTKELRKAAVVDRSGAQAAGEVLTSLGFEILAVENGASAGAKKNRGLGETAGDVVLISAEVRLPDPDWLRAMAEETRSRGGVAGLKVVDGDGIIGSCGYHMTLPEYRIYRVGGEERISTSIITAERSRG